LPAWRDYILEKVMLIDVMLKQKRGLGPIEFEKDSWSEVMRLEGVAHLSAEPNCLGYIS